MNYDKCGLVNYQRVRARLLPEKYVLLLYQG